MHKYEKFTNEIQKIHELKTIKNCELNTKKFTN